MDYVQIASKVKREKAVTLKNWRQSDLVRWLRDGCRCVYCGQDLLINYDTTYYSYTYDHLLPQSLYPELRDLDWNNLLSCRVCNCIKSDWNPNIQPPQSEIYSAGSCTITPEGITELLNRAKSYVAEARRGLVARFEEERQVVRAALNELQASEIPLSPSGDS